MTPQCPCACCGYLVFAEPLGSDDICPICFWEDDLVQIAFPDLAGGANKCSLIEGQRNFAECGACEKRILPHVQPPGPKDVRDPSWRPLDADRDLYLHWGRRDDHDFWQSIKDTRDKCLYYWKPDYSLRSRRR
ncbi:MAG: hypothetical protein IMZ44_17360 [Planctomycetes bacterium]|nr:hypothetical protein [Planctomycetota bacterium]